METMECSFVEIHSDNDDDNDETTSSSNIQSSLCDAYVAVIEPKQCSSLVKRLTRELPLPEKERQQQQHTTANGNGKMMMALDLSHLKRVKRFNINSSSSSSSIRENSSSTIHIMPVQSAATAAATGDDEAAPAGDLDSNKRQKTNVHCSSSAHDDGSAVTATPMTTTDDAILSSAEKKKNHQFGVLLGPVLTLDRLYGEVPHKEDKVNEAATTTTTTSATTAIATLKALYNLNEIIIVQVPRRLAESKQEHKLFNETYWPCLYFPQKTKQYKMDQRQLYNAEVEQMKMGITQALQDALECQKQIQMQHQQQQNEQMMSTVIPSSAAVGTVVVSPADGHVVARACEERALQQQQAAGLFQSQNNNPLQTSVMLALQGVARLERQTSAMTCQDGTIQSNDLCNGGQYLCTGYDVYTTLEPTVMDAMAMVHARVRRVIFGASSATDDANSGLDDYSSCGLTVVRVHALPGTNHKYRAFMCQTGSKLWNECRLLLLQQPQEQQQQHPNEQKGHNNEL